MTVDGAGNWCTLEERLNDLSKRHGINSEVYKEYYELAVYLRKLGFDDSVYQWQIDETMNLSKQIIGK